MVTAKHISKTYGTIKVLKDVALEVKKGEVIAIVGPSGAGKTTLLQILGTLDFPEKNEQTTLEINGENSIGLSPKELSAFRNKHIGFIFQFHQLLPEFTAVENVCIPAYIAKKGKKESEERARELLSFLGLSHRYEHKPSELSGGEQQRVAVARALMNKPALILADEPSGNLDSESAEMLHDLFFKLRDNFGHTIIIVTHNQELAAMADRTLTMVDGEFVNS